MENRKAVGRTISNRQLAKHHHVDSQPRQPSSSLKKKKSHLTASEDFEDIYSNDADGKNYSKIKAKYYHPQNIAVVDRRRSPNKGEEVSNRLFSKNIGNSKGALLNTDQNYSALYTETNRSNRPAH
jgi:hypothetical protein